MIAVITPLTRRILGSLTLCSRLQAVTKRGSCSDAKSCKLLEAGAEFRVIDTTKLVARLVPYLQRHPVLIEFSIPVRRLGSRSSLRYIPLCPA
ncbi:hypothetical protein BDU57DRAFT_522056 [Ampelomyces quisqualis]|uniref:Uncharacterized protein n=1 Tax=Ampelomyces quisqualis TaxID=50730 RepID=A0A6A5QD58_AMPQU|nr:hypothetical protein BDU57DRAFT_522056 [Ampelomyces quisqualis]